MWDLDSDSWEVLPGVVTVVSFGCDGRMMLGECDAALGE